MSAYESNRFLKVKVGKDLSDTYNYCQKMKNTKCVMNMKIECYHWRRSGGKNKSRRKVVTFNKTKKLKYKSWVDVSEFPNFNEVRSNLIHVYTEMEFGYADRETKIKMEKKIEKFIKKYKNRDSHYSFKLVGSVGDLIASTDNDFVFAKNGNVPFFFRPVFYWLSLLFCYGPIYRIIHDFAFRSVRFKIKKLISRSNTLPSKTNAKYKSDFTDFQAFNTYQQGYYQDPDNKFADVQAVSNVNEMDWTFGGVNNNQYQAIPINSDFSNMNYQDTQPVQQQPIQNNGYKNSNVSGFAPLNTYEIKNVNNNQAIGYSANVPISPSNVQLQMNNYSNSNVQQGIPMNNQQQGMSMNNQNAIGLNQQPNFQFNQQLMTQGMPMNNQQSQGGMQMNNQVNLQNDPLGPPQY